MIDSMFGHMRKVGMVSFCCLLVLSIFVYAQETPKERPATLIVSPASAKAKAVIVIQGSQFLPGEEVEVIMTVGDVYHGLGTAKADVIVADKNGTFEVSSGIPLKTPPGTYKIEATGNKGSVGIFNITVVK
jgi:hypothetical protein